jgi:trimeric autotransporter adhesin
MKSLPLVALACLLPHSNAQHLACQPEFNSPGSQIFLVDSAGTSDNYGGHLPFKYSGTIFGDGTPVADAQNFVVLIPSSGVTSAGIQVGLNPSAVLQYQPGLSYTIYVQFTTVGVTPASSTACAVTLSVPPEPAPTIQAVANAASLQPSISPGAMVSVLGSHLTGPTQSTTFGPTASFPTSVAGTSVTFNGIAAPLLYISPTQINAIVPFALAGQTSAQIAVRRLNLTTPTFTVPLQNTSPAIFTAAQTGTGQGAILQQGSDGTFSYNSSDNPAAAGVGLEIFATGMGVWTPAPQGDVFLYGEAFTTQPVSVTIGGQPAKILYAGTLGATLSSWSVLQVNVVLPAGLPAGPQPVVLKIGANNSQQNVTLWAQ